MTEVQPVAARRTAGGSRTRAPSMTVACCIEAGELEEKTIRLVESLRRFGGRFRDLEVIAVTPRFGPSLARGTRKRMAELGIRHVRARPRTRFVWHHYMNKAQALQRVEELVDTDAIAWLDGDLLVLREPNDLELPPGVDFRASAPDRGEVSSIGSRDPHDAFWSRAAAMIGRNVDDLPWLETADGHRIRFYWNAGLFVYRRASGFGHEFTGDFERALQASIALTHGQVHALDQVVLGLTALRLGLAWQAVPVTANFPVLSFVPENFDPEMVRGVEILHYHDSMQPELWPKLLATLSPYHGEVVEWLAPLGPVTNELPAGKGYLRQALRIQRGIRRRLYYARHGFTMRSADIR